MIVYIINYLLCSTALYLTYRLALESSSMHFFKRIYLLVVLLLPMLLPIIEYDFNDNSIVAETTLLPNIRYKEHSDSTAVERSDLSLLPQETGYNLTYIVYVLYVLISLILLSRFLINIGKIHRLVLNSKIVKRHNYTVVLTTSRHDPYTFLNKIFVNEKVYQDGLHPSIWRHEQSHVEQRHTLDIILAELVSVFFWFNPINILIKRAIQLNHEYLADQSVVSNREYLQEYAYLLLNIPSIKPNSNLTSPLNYKQVKNRLIMMTKETSTKKQLALAILAICIISAAMLLFVQKNILRASPKELTVNLVAEADTIKHTGAPAKLLAEYDSVMNAITTLKKNNKGGLMRSVNATGVDRNRMAYIVSLMSIQQIKDRIKGDHGQASPEIWITMTTKPKKKTPTAKEYDNWYNTKIYGVWIDGKKVKNSDLQQLKREDIVLYYVSKLYGKAKEGRAYTHQLDVYSEPYYNKVFANHSGYNY